MLCCVSVKMAFDVVHSGLTEDNFSTPFESQSIWDRNEEFREHMGNATEDQVFEYLMSVVGEIKQRQRACGYDESDPMMSSLGYIVFTTRRSYLTLCHLENSYYNLSSDDDDDELQTVQCPAAVGAGWTCPICLDDSQVDVYYFPGLCHTFHETCINTWLKYLYEHGQVQTCPVCRQL